MGLEDNDPQVALDGAYIGCSIAVNGTCLTVTEFDAKAGETELTPMLPWLLEKSIGLRLSLFFFCFCGSRC